MSTSLCKVRRLCGLVDRIVATFRWLGSEQHLSSSRRNAHWRALLLVQVKFLNDVITVSVVCEPTFCLSLSVCLWLRLSLLSLRKSFLASASFYDSFCVLFRLLASSFFRIFHHRILRDFFAFLTASHSSSISWSNFQTLLKIHLFRNIPPVSKNCFSPE